MSLRSLALVVVCFAAGCGLFHRAEPDGEHEADAGVVERTNGSAGNASRVGNDSNVRVSEVWIGQLRSTSALFCGPERDFDVPVSHELERVVLVLETRADGGSTGRIAFGEPDARPLPVKPWRSDGAFSLFAECSTFQPVRAAEYTLLDVVRTGEIVSFNIAPKEYWDAWCHAKDECPSNIARLCVKSGYARASAGRAQLI
jgi:hypothetical protein